MAQYDSLSTAGDLVNDSLHEIKVSSRVVPKKTVEQPWGLFVHAFELFRGKAHVTGLFMKSLIIIEPQVELIGNKLGNFQASASNSRCYGDQ